MGKLMPWNDIPDSNVFPTGDYHVMGVKLEEMYSKEASKLMYSIDVVIVEHPNTAPFTNQHFFENFVIGNDDDPNADVPGTWVQSVGARRMKQCLAAAQVAEKADMDKICASFVNTQFIIGIQEYKEPMKTRDGQDNPYGGQPRNKSTGFYKIGSREPKLEPKKPGAPTAPAGPVAPAPAVAPTQAPPAPAAPAPVSPAPVAPAAPAAPPAPAVPAAPAAPTTVAPAPAGDVQMTQCTICGQSIPSLQFADHVNACLAAQAGKG